jgi:predicted phage-related endonuclease
MTTTTERPRTSYLGGGDAAAICGKSEWRTPMDVWLEKTGKAAPLVLPERVQWGLHLEPAILAEWGRRADSIVEPGNFCVDPKEPWRAGHPDALARRRGDSADLRLLEVKTTALAFLPTWNAGIPIDYQYQAQHYLALTGLPLCTYPVLFGGQKLLDFHLEADPIVQHEIQTCAKDFWHSYVLKDQPPPGASVEHAGHLFGTREVTKSERQALTDLCLLRAQGKSHAEQEETLLTQLREWGRDVTLTVDGKVIAEWKQYERKAYTVPASAGTRFQFARYPSIAKALGIKLDDEDRP